MVVHPLEPSEQLERMPLAAAVLRCLMSMLQFGGAQRKGVTKCGFLMKMATC